MLKIKPKALLVCGIIATASGTEYRLTEWSIRHRTKMTKNELHTLLMDMMEADMIEAHFHDGYAIEYSLKTFQAEINS